MGKNRATESGSCRIYLVHGSGYENVGDSAQMLSTIERLERIIPACEVIVAKMYTVDDGSLWGGRESAPSLHLYICRPHGIITNVISNLLTRLRAKGLATALLTIMYMVRASLILAAAACQQIFKKLPLINAQARAAIQAIRSCDVVYCSGGGNLNDIWLSAELLPRVVTYRVAALLNKPVIISGQGIGPLHSRLGRCLLRWGMRHASFIGCRDAKESSKLLLELGVKKSLVQSLGDDAMDLRTADIQRVREIFAQEGLPVDSRPLLAVHVRLHNFRQDFRDIGIPFLAELLDCLIEKIGFWILFIPISYWNRKVFEGDLGDAFEVYAKMKRRDKVSFLCREKYSPPELKGVVSSCKMLIGFSYHSWIFALTSGVPAFGIFKGEYFSMKSKGLFEWYNREDWIWNIEGANASSIINKIKEVVTHYDQNQEELLRISCKMVENVEIPVKFVKIFLNEISKNNFL